MEIITKKKNSKAIKFSDLKYGDVFSHDENETGKFNIYVKIDNTDSESRSLRLGDFKPCWTANGSNCYLINATLTLYNE
jgi:hypothetical protein